MWQKFSERARRVILLAQEEATQANAATITSDYLLLAILRERDGVAGQVPSRFGVTLEAVRAEVAPHNAHAKPLTPLQQGNGPLLSPDARRVLERTNEESLQLGHDYIGTNHLLLALARSDEAQPLLSRHGLNYERLRAGIEAYLGPEHKGTNAA